MASATRSEPWPHRVLRIQPGALAIAAAFAAVVAAVDTPQLRAAALRTAHRRLGLPAGLVRAQHRLPGLVGTEGGQCLESESPELEVEVLELGAELVGNRTRLFDLPHWA
jgi:hypothetical protein